MKISIFGHDAVFGVLHSFLPCHGSTANAIRRSYARCMPWAREISTLDLTCSSLERMPASDSCRRRSISEEDTRILLLLQQSLA